MLPLPYDSRVMEVKMCLFAFQISQFHIIYNLNKFCYLRYSFTIEEIYFKIKLLSHKCVDDVTSSITYLSMIEPSSDL